ncbi:hypothetical protein R0G64_27775 [Pseudomonas otitidis]|uniref:Transposase, Mutator family n=1 Tax=Metapseudomonas otitidis TaxID=319939 RepID=A0ABU3XZ81_9GAMM|nr:hypothetical protein [Pseudomonas otitidis]MDV3443217.1 hypothetical protein [Pseudomonas otitidis]
MLNIDAHQRLRNAMEAEIVARVPDTQQARHILDACMRQVLLALLQQQLARSELDRQFREFHRDPKASAPAWAFRSPGTRPQRKPLR